MCFTPLHPFHLFGSTACSSAFRGEGLVRTHRNDGSYQTRQRSLRSSGTVTDCFRQGAQRSYAPCPRTSATEELSSRPPISCFGPSLHPETPMNKGLSKKGEGGEGGKNKLKKGSFSINNRQTPFWGKK